MTTTLLATPSLGLVSYGCSRQGASHKLAKPPLPCQDAHLVTSGSFADLPYLIVAVADGHGDKKHDRSQLGASFAVSAATKAMTEMLEHSNADECQLRQLFLGSYVKLVRRLWREQVVAHAMRLDDQEGTSCKDENNLFSRYGTTLLACMILPQTVFCAQIGDGDIIVIDTEGELSELFPSGGSLVGGETFSLSSNDVELLMRVKVVERTNQRFFALSSDGLRNAYDSDEKFYRLLRSVLQQSEQVGLMKLAEAIPDYLDRFSEKGSGDDITLVTVIVAGEQDAKEISEVDGQTATPQQSQTTHVIEVRSCQHSPTTDRSATQFSKTRGCPFAWHVGQRKVLLQYYPQVRKKIRPTIKRTMKKK